MIGMGLDSEKIVSYKCRRCNEVVFPKREFPAPPPHFGKYICPDCGLLLDWIPKPKVKKARDVGSVFSLAQIAHHHDFPVAFCFFCSRRKHELGKYETLEKDHIIELVDGGKDLLTNLQILCTACHRMKLWYKTYVVNHLVRWENFKLKEVVKNG